MPSVSPTRVGDSRSFRVSFGVAALAAVTMLSVLFAHRYSSASHASSVFDLGYDNGPVIRNLVLRHQYGSLVSPGNIWAVAQRMPLVPLFLALVAHFSVALTPAFMIKNLLAWMLTILALLRIARAEKSPANLLLAAFFLLVFLPYNSYVAFAIEYEEGYLFHLLMLLFSFVVYAKRRGDLVAIGVLLFLIYLTKSSMAGLCALVAIGVMAEVLSAARTGIFPGLALANRSAACIPAVFLLVAACSWGIFTLEKTGHFAIGATSSSLNGLNFYKGNNSDFAGLYPEINLDVLESYKSFAPSRPVRDEWDLNRYYEDRAFEFISRNPKQALRNDLTKLYVALLGVEDVELGARNMWLVRGSMLVNRLLLWTGIVVAMDNIRRSVGRGNPARALPSFYLLGFIVSFVPPYIVGFANNRQMVPIFGVCCLFLFLEVSRRLEPSR